MHNKNHKMPNGKMMSDKEMKAMMSGKGGKVNYKPVSKGKKK